MAKKFDFSKLSRQNIRSLRPYEAKEIPCRVKLDANESPYEPFPLAEWREKALSLNRYPDPDAGELKKKISRAFSVRPEEVLPGNGSDELIYYLIATFGGPVLYPVPTFSMYGIIAQSLGERHKGVPLDGEFDLDREAMIAVVKTERPALLFLSSPNNPTGNCFSTEKILGIIEASKGIVVVDEAYQPFSSERGFLPFLKDYPNLVVLRTMSKIGFASLRVGFMMADRGLIAEVNKVRLPFNLNGLSQAVAVESFKRKRAVQAAVRSIIMERGRLSAALRTLEGVTPHPSEANFILITVKDAEAVHRKLLKAGVLVRNLNGTIKGALRVTVGTPAENALFLEALKKAVGRKQT
ncbi:MAG: histidinol-phosphate transaminase [Nitrospirales bacterium]|nr:histidinol-phosphate transaminase [Nitrospirales bacterium]